MEKKFLVTKSQLKRLINKSNQQPELAFNWSLPTGNVLSFLNKVRVNDFDGAMYKVYRYGSKAPYVVFFVTEDGVCRMIHTNSPSKVQLAKKFTSQDDGMEFVDSISKDKISEYLSINDLTLNGKT